MCGGEGGVGGGAQLQTSAWPVITAQSEYMGRVDFHIIAPTCIFDHSYSIFCITIPHCINIYVMVYQISSTFKYQISTDIYLLFLKCMMIIEKKLYRFAVVSQENQFY